MRTVFYYSMLGAGLLIAIAIAVVCGKYRGLSKRNSVMFTITGFLSGVLGAMLMSIIYNVYLDALYGGPSHETSRFSLFGALLFMPFLLMIPAKKLQLSFGELSDTIAPGVFAVLTTGKIGCFVNGCCAGIPSTCGVINPISGAEVVPIQLYEAAFTFVLVAAGIFAIKKIKALRGILYPVTLALYCVGRFCAEFLRAAFTVEKDFFNGLDFWQNLCIITFVVCMGITAVAVVRRKKSCAESGNEAA